MPSVTINEQTFPVIACLDNNVLNSSLQYILENSGYSEESCKSIKESFIFFEDKSIEIDYVSTTLHQKLLDSHNFKQAKLMLDNTAEKTGLLLLPETMYADFSQVPDYVDVDATQYPINAILYSWLPIDDHDRLTGDYNEEEPWHRPQDRALLILPIHDDRITQATDQRHLICYSEEYGMPWREGDGREWYGKIHDYVMSYFIFECMRIQKSNDTCYRTIKYQMEYVDNPYGNNIKIIDLME